MVLLHRVAPFFGVRKAKAGYACWSQIMTAMS